MTKTNDPYAGGDWAIVNDPNVYDPNGAYCVETFTYDGLGRPLTAAKVVDGNDIAESVFAYDDLGTLDSEAQTLFGGTERTVTYGYDHFGYRTSIGYPDGSTTINETSTWDGRLDTVSRGQTPLASYQYVGPRTARRSYHTTTPVNQDTVYDNLGRVTDITAGSLVDFHYSYAADENNISQTRFDHRGGTPSNQYAYDDIDRITGITYLDSDTESFSMDDLGNRDGDQTLRDDGTVNFAVDAATNRYTAVGGNSLDYDDAGNLTEDRDGYAYTYDTENRITKIVDDQDTLIAEYDYDVFGRRIRSYDGVAETTTLYYYSDGWQVLAEHDGSSFTNEYVYGNDVTEPLVVNDGTNDYFYLHDHLYSTVALVNSAGAVVERYEYDAYGKVSILSPNYELRTTSSVGNPYLFAGYRFDANTGLYHTLYRSYDPYTGRWLQHDPLGYADSMSLYEYVMSNPMRYSDPWGLWSGSYNYIGGTPYMSEEEAEIIVSWVKINVKMETPNCGCEKNLSVGDNIKVNSLEIIGWSAGFSAQSIANLFQGLQDGAVVLVQLSFNNTPIGMTYKMSTGKSIIPDSYQWAHNRYLEQSDFVYGTHKFINSTLATLGFGALLSEVSQAGTLTTVASGPLDEAGSLMDDVAACTDDLKPWQKYEIKHGGQQTTMKTVYKGKKVTVRLDKPPTNSKIVDFKDYNWSNPAYNKPFVQDKVTRSFQEQIMKYQTIKSNVHFQFSQNPPQWVVEAIESIGGTYSVVP